MPYRKDEFAPGEYYHIYNRGVAKEPLFYSAANYEHCLRLIKQYRSPYGATIVAYCLMPNHYHFCLRQESEAPLSRFINVVFNAYVQALNHQLGRQGTLFEGRFRHVRIAYDEYLVQLCRYIHLNPVKAGLVSHPRAWPYSNYLEWTGERNGIIKDDLVIRTFFPAPGSYQAFVANAQAPLAARMKDYLLDE